MDSAKKRVSKYYKYLPFAGLFALTAILMIVFKTSDSTNDAFRQGKDAIIGFYTNNLIPIFDKNEITDEDIFNLAVNSRIPVDKEQNRILKIGEDQNGSKSFQVKPGEYVPGTNNLKRFEKFLQLDEKQSEELNSLLESYREELYSMILQNENNTFAVDPNIEILRKSIAAELYQFAIKNNSDRTRYLDYDRKEDITRKLAQLKSTLADTEKRNKTNFIFFGPDTIFSQECDVDKDEMKKLARANAVATAKGGSASATATSSSSSSKGIRVLTKPEVPTVKPADNFSGLNMAVFEDDSKVIIPRGVFVDNFIGENNSLNFSLDSLSNTIKSFTFSLTSDSSNYMKFEIGENGDNYNFKMDFDAFDINEIVEAASEIANDADVEKWENFGAAFDSMMINMNIEDNDSSFFINTNGFKFKINKKEKKEKPDKEKLD
ncbi:MAG: hypothetical protein SCALA702_33320 [Melioribacteraceae bacterium]|nr:MAG: hypothetical protein SCALA702_33320 [Melioribacteraceae bacterium]